jgi:hypothetical protein
MLTAVANTMRDGMIMTDPTVPSPDSIPATGDPGDDTARRYRYQWTYAAIVCCLLLDEIDDVTEVFCEHHEDVLIKHADGMCSGSVKLDRILPGFGFRRSSFFQALRLEFCRGQIA